MRKYFKGALFLMIIGLIAVGCTPAVPGEGQPKQGDENALSPIPNEAAQTVKKTVTFYYADKDLMKKYRVEGEIEADNEAQLPEVALKKWMKGPEQEGLANLVPPEVVLEKAEFKDGIAYVSFSKEIRNANLGSSGEMFLIEQIVLTMKQFGYSSTQILVEGKAEESLLGHVTTDSPIAATDAESYEWYK